MWCSWPVWTFLLGMGLTHAYTLDSVRLWNDSLLICGYPVKSLPKDVVLEDMLKENNTKISKNQKTMKQNPFNQTSLTRKIVISYEDFLCCLKNIWISVKNNNQKQKCLKLFMKCVKANQEQKCIIPWTYYVNLAVHDLRVATMMVVTCGIFFVTSVVLVEKCKESGYDSVLD